MVKVLCDKCGAEITKDPIRLNMTYVDVMTGDIEDPITSKEQGNGITVNCVLRQF